MGCSYCCWGFWSSKLCCLCCRSLSDLYGLESKSHRLQCAIRTNCLERQITSNLKLPAPSVSIQELPNSKVTSPTSNPKMNAINYCMETLYQEPSAKEYILFNNHNQNYAKR